MIKNKLPLVHIAPGHPPLSQEREGVCLVLSFATYSYTDCFCPLPFRPQANKISATAPLCCGMHLFFGIVWDFITIYNMAFFFFFCGGGV
jgi:hypothetical protein